MRGDDQIAAAVEVIARADADVLLLTGIDYDHGLAALTALNEALAARGAGYPHLFALRPNAGLATSLDLDGDGRTGGPRDAQGYGRFSGAGGMALLSRLDVLEERVQDLSPLLWKDLPGARLPEVAGLPFPSAEAQAAQRLSSTGHWDVPLRLPDGGEFRVLAFAATPPVFDGPEDRNGLRNHDEIALWQRHLDGAVPGADPPRVRFAVMGNANLDPWDGEGRREAIAALLADPRLSDAAPNGMGGRAAADPGHRGPPAQDTVAFGAGVGNLRVDYVLPSAEMEVVGAGIFWPAPDDPFAAITAAASRHRLVWVDVIP